MFVRGGQAKAAGVTPAGAMKGVKVAKDLGITPKDALKGAKMASLAAKELARIVCDGLAVLCFDASASASACVAQAKGLGVKPSHLMKLGKALK